MAGNPVLADSSFYITLLRQGRDPLRALAATSMTKDLAVCGVIRCEVGRGMRHPSVLDRFRAAWNVMLNIPTDNRLWDTAESTLWQLDRRGIILPLTDVLIACCAMRIGATVLTFDGHFKEIPGLDITDRWD
jgi:predicted nucleic acid-binding protein